MLLDDVKKHVRRRYMSGIERDTSRIKDTSEVFTPTDAVQSMLKKLGEEVFKDPTKTFIDSSCGDGQFLTEVLILKMENGSTYEEALSTIYGVDLMPDNVVNCRERLLCEVTDKKYLSIVERNIVNEDSLTYKFKFLKKDVKTTKELKELIERADRDKKLILNGVTLY